MNAPCKCGCGNYPKTKAEYCKGHATRSEEARSNISKVRTGKHHTKETRDKISRSNIGKRMSIETRKNMSISKSGINHPLYGKHRSYITRIRISKSNCGKKRSFDTCSRISQSRRGMKLSKEHCKNLSKSLSGRNNPFYGKTHTLKVIDNLSKVHRNKWKEPGYREYRSELMKSYWLDPIFQNRMRVSNRKPNNAEKQLNKLLQKILPGTYKYVGNYRLFIGGKNPDFISIDGQKKIIELAGEHWHKKSYSKLRGNYFKNYGYKTLVIWCKELKKNNREELINKLYEFDY